MSKKQTLEELQAECDANALKLLGPRGVERLRVIDLMVSISEKLNVSMEEALSVMFEAMGTQARSKGILLETCTEQVKVGYDKAASRRSRQS